MAKEILGDWIHSSVLTFVWIKSTPFEISKLGTHLDVQNVTNYKNVEIQSWSYDYSEETPFKGNRHSPYWVLKESGDETGIPFVGSHQHERLHRPDQETLVDELRVMAIQSEPAEVQLRDFSR